LPSFFEKPANWPGAPTILYKLSGTWRAKLRRIIPQPVADYRLHGLHAFLGIV
jgi:hypothetical protein